MFVVLKSSDPVLVICLSFSSGLCCLWKLSGVTAARISPHATFYIKTSLSCFLLSARARAGARGNVFCNVLACEENMAASLRAFRAEYSLWRCDWSKLRLLTLPAGWKKSQRDTFCIVPRNTSLVLSSTLKFVIILGSRSNMEAVSIPSQ